MKAAGCQSLGVAKRRSLPVSSPAGVTVSRSPVGVHRAAHSASARLVFPWLFCSLWPLTYLCYPSHSAFLHALAPSCVHSLFIHSFHLLICSHPSVVGPPQTLQATTEDRDCLPAWVCGFRQGQLLEGEIREHWLRVRAAPVTVVGVASAGQCPDGLPPPCPLPDRDLLASVRPPCHPLRCCPLGFGTLRPPLPPI